MTNLIVDESLKDAINPELNDFETPDKDQDKEEK